MLAINDLKAGTFIEYKKEPYLVISVNHLKLGRGGAILQTKLKNLITNNVLRKNFKGNDKFGEPNLEKILAQFLYRQNDQFHFMDEKTYEQFSLSQKQIGPKGAFLKEGAKVTIINFNNKPINVDLPLKINLEVVEAPPGVRGNTAQGGTKQVILETGAKIIVPLFIKKGDQVRVNTETGEYVERA